VKDFEIITSIFANQVHIWQCKKKTWTTTFDAPPNSLMDSTTSLKEKTTERGVGAHSLTHNIFGVEGHARAPKWGLGRLTNKSITHMDPHKPNKKLTGKHKLTRLTTAQTWGKPPLWGTLPNSQHFRGRGACWRSEMGIRKIDKQVIWTRTNQTKS